MSASSGGMPLVKGVGLSLVADGLLAGRYGREAAGAVSGSGSALSGGQGASGGGGAAAVLCGE